MALASGTIKSLKEKVPDELVNGVCPNNPTGHSYEDYRGGGSVGKYLQCDFCGALLPS